MTASPSLLFVTGMSVTLGDNPLSNSDWKVGNVTGRWLGERDWKVGNVTGAWGKMPLLLLVLQARVRAPPRSLRLRLVPLALDSLTR